MTAEQNVQVTQADREAAAELLSAYDEECGKTERGLMRTGELDFHPLVQAFARFEHDTEKRVRESVVPIDLLLFCPKCGLQHIDEPDERTPEWDNPPHRSHLCHGCGCIWRPADVPTNGVRGIATVGKADTWAAADGILREILAGEMNVERVASAIHEHLSRRNIMQYLDNDEDCEGIARAALSTLERTTDG